MVFILALLFDHDTLELDTFSNETDVMWRGFVASAVAAVSLQWVDPFGTAKLVLFQVHRGFRPFCITVTEGNLAGHQC